MMPGGYEVIGADRLRSTLRAAGKSLDEPRTAPTAAAALVARAARPPVVSGRLRGSISPGRAEANVGVVRASAPYAGVIHWGWPARGIRANPFLSDAATGTEAAWIQFYEQEIDDALDKVKGA